MPSDVILRAASAADHEALIVLWRRAVEATHHFLTRADIDVDEAALRDRHLTTLSVTVADSAGRPCGFVGVDGDRVEMLFVDPDHHGRGVGTRLLDHVADDTRSLDVNEQNAGAVRFYAARGFVVTGRSATDGDGRPFPVLHLHRG